MNSYKPGDVYRDLFPTQNTSGAATNADSLPTASLYRNNAIDNAVTVTVANVTTGIYSLSCTIPVSYAAGDTVQILVNATIGGTAAKATRPAVRLVAYDITDGSGLGLTFIDGAISDIPTNVRNDEVFQRMIAAVGAYGGSQTQANGVITQTLAKPGGGNLRRVYEGGTMTNTDTA